MGHYACMSQKEDVPDNPWVFLLLGAVGSAFALLLLAMPDGPPEWVGLAFLWAGSTIALIGAIGVGVTLGNVRAAWALRQARD